MIETETETHSKGNEIMDQLREISRQLEAAEIKAHRATTWGDRRRARKSIATLRKQARRAVAAYRKGR